jgi:hypothetical protein
MGSAGQHNPSSQLLPGFGAGDAGGKVSVGIAFGIVVAEKAGFRIAGMSSHDGAKDTISGNSSDLSLKLLFVGRRFSPNALRQRRDLRTAKQRSFWAMPRRIAPLSP